MLTAEVDDEEVRKRRLPRRLPIRGLLEIEDFITSEVTTIDFLTVSIFHRPRFTRKTIPIGITDIEFGYGDLRFFALRR